VAEIKEFAKGVTSAFALDGLAVGQVTFDFGAFLHRQLTSYTQRSVLNFDIDIAPFNGGGTFNYRGLQKAQQVLASTGRPLTQAKHIVILITDGGTFDPVWGEMKATEMKIEQTEIFVIAVGNWQPHVTHLKNMATMPTNKHFKELQLGSSQSVRQVTKFIIDQACL